MVALSLLASAQAQSPEPSTPAAKADSTAADEKKPDFSKEAFILERLYENYRFENDGTGKKTARMRIHVLSESGVRAFGQLQFGYNAGNDRMDISYVRVTKSDGSLVTAGQDAIQDLTPLVRSIAPVYTDYHEKHVTVPGLRPGDILECEVITTFHTPLAVGQFWTSHDFNQSSVVLDEQLDIDVPSTRTVKLKTKPGLDPKITEANGRRVYHWSSSHLVGSEETKDTKDKKDKKKKKKTDEAPDVQMTTFSSWEEVGRWYAALEKDRRVPSPEVRAKAKDLTKGLNSDLDKTQALYDFVAQNFRYVSLSLGLARYQPQAAADILRNQYGDCKDKNTLLAALLEAEGIHSSTVLINTFRKLDPDVPSPSQFNHAITLVPIGKDPIWLDTTAEVAPFGLIAYPIRKKQALVIPPGGTPHLEESPEAPFVPDKVLTEIVGKVDDTGRLNATIRYSVRGDAEIVERSIFRGIPAAQWDKAVERMNQGLGGEVSNVKVSELLATREPFTISYDVSKENFLDGSKKKIQLRLPLASVSLGKVGDDADEDSDSDDSSKPEPLKIGPTHEHSYRIKLDVASRFRLTAPVPVAISRDYGAYQSSYKVDGGTFTAERKLSTSLAELAPDRAEDYRAFRRTVVADSTQFLALENLAIDTHASPGTTSAADLIRNGNEARKNGHYGTAIDLLNRAVEAEPKSKKAWNDLGLAYLDDQQDNLAINAFQKQIEVDAFNENAFNNLGRVYLRQRKYPDADKWFSKQIEVQPLDKYAHWNLGVSLTEEHKYDDAVAELEKAASITPDNSNVQVSLGRAYLNLGQDDKAMAAFDKALGISASASVWNSIAYRLSEKKAHLDRARSYAESAVSSTAANLRNISLDHLSQRDPSQVSSIASYWDTLGWVAFAEGKNEVAERFVSAAWTLSQHSEDGDHLGQIYEKEGKKAEAVHAYALSMNAERPEPETRDRLASLVGGADKVDAAVEKCKAELLQSRTYHLPNSGKVEGKADFFILLNHGSEATATVEGVSYVSGEEKLKAMIEPLKATKFKQTFPDDTQLKILRRGTLTCKPDSECSFLLTLPTEVKAID